MQPKLDNNSIKFFSEVYILIQVKDIKSIKIIPYANMISSISAVFSLICAIFLIVIYLGEFSSAWRNTSSIITLIIVALLLFPTVGFLLSIVASYLTILIYNVLVPKIGAIKLGFEDLKEIKNVPVMPFSLMISSIFGIIISIITLIVVSALGLSLCLFYAAVPSLSNFEGITVIKFLAPAIAVVLGILIFNFISMAIMAIFYNFLAPKIGGIMFNFVNSIGKFYEIESIPVVSFALITSLVIALFSLLIEVIGLIVSIVMGISIITALISMVTNVLFDLILGFVICAIAAALYNYLQPKIGGIKLEMD